MIDLNKQLKTIEKIVKYMLPYGAVLLYKNIRENRLRYTNIFNNTQCDFYVIETHGVGLQSLLYYLSLTGIPSSSWWSESILPVPKTQKIYAQGITTSYISEEHIKKQKNADKAIWILRDPILILRSCINQSIGDRIVAKELDISIYNPDVSVILNRLLDKTSNIYCKYISKVRNFIGRGQIYSFDMEEIMPEHCSNTIRSLASLFGAPPPKCSDYVFTISFNSFKNRFLSNFPQFRIRRGKHDIILGVTASELFDFQYNHWRSYPVVDNIVVNGESYVIFLKHIDNAFNPFSTFEISSISLSDAERTAISFFISEFMVFMSFADTVYKKHAISEEYLVEFFLKNKKYYDMLMFVLEDELELLDNIAPGHVEKWKYYNMLL